MGYNIDEIGALPISRQEYIQGEEYFLGNLVGRYGYCFECIVDSTTTAPAIMQDDELVVNEGWRIFAGGGIQQSCKNKQDKVDDNLQTNSKEIVGAINEVNSKVDSQGSTDYNDLENKPTINEIPVRGNLTLQDLGIQPSGNYITQEEVNTIVAEALNNYSTAEEVNTAISTALQGYATTESVNELIKNALLNYVTKDGLTKELENYARTTDIPDISGLASKEEVEVAISNQKFKTVNGQEITGEGNIEIQGGSTVTVDDTLNEESVNPVQNKVIASEISSMKELLALLDDKVFPTTLTVTGGGTFDEGTTQTVTVSWNLKKNEHKLTPDSVTVNGETVDPATSYKVFTDVTATTTYRVAVVYQGKTYNGSTTVTFKKTYYRYYGALPVDTEVGSITVDMVKGLKKEVCTGAAAVLLFTTVNQRMAYAYPSVFGRLTAIKDTNLNAPFDDFLLELTLDIDGTEYYVYALTTPNVVTDYSVTFVK